MRMTSKPLGAIILVILFGGILVTTAMNIWQTESSKTPVTFSSGEAAGEYNPADIRGSYTLGEVSDLFKIPLEDLRNAFALYPEDDAASYSLKNFETRFASQAAEGKEIGTGSVRLFVALYRGLPYELEDDYLPAPAVALLKNTANLTPEQVTYLENHSVEVESNVEVPAPAVASTAIVSPETSEFVIKGKTTVGELISWGVTEDVISQILGRDLPEPGVTLKDFCASEGLSFEDTKTALQLEVDKLK